MHKVWDKIRGHQYSTIFKLGERTFFFLKVAIELKEHRQVLKEATLSIVSVLQRDHWGKCPIK